MKIPNFLKFILMLILFLALGLRLYDINWDQGNHLHPDERMITMVAQNIKIPDLSGESKFADKISILFSPASSLNPKFFAYGTFPIYLLKMMSGLFAFIDPKYLTYDYMNLLGRGLSALFDTFTVILVFQITQNLFFSTKKSLVAALIYALSVLPIQLSHFYAVDTLLTFFIIFTLYHAVRLYHRFNLIDAFFVGLGFGLALATKISALVLIFSLGFSLFIGFLLTLKKQIFGQEIKFFSKIKKYFQKLFQPHFWVNRSRRRLEKIVLYFSLISLITIIVFVICEPFSIFDFSVFWSQLNEQQAMTHNAFVFPYTLQYVNTPAYLYPLKNIFLWGLGPVFGLISFVGLAFSLVKLFKGLFTPGNEKSEGGQLIILSFFFVYFLIVGDFAVKFIRYCLPLYPIFAIFAANFIFSFRPKLSRVIAVSVFTIHFFVLITFLSIYRQPNTRVLATDWINANIPAGSKIVREHWDDGLPIGNDRDYQLSELPLYDPDSSPDKWIGIKQQLASADYLVIASNRLYVPLQKLTNCEILPPGKCYNLTAEYYRQLFSGHLGFTKVAEFSDNPKLFGVTINDQSADESFTVYDHPIVMIFKKN